jgi:Domain of unknown function (DUF222)
LSDDELTGALQAARRLENRAAYLQAVAVAEFARRHAARFEDAKARKVPAGRRPGEFPGEELAIELVASGNYADMRIEHDLALTARLPRTLAGMAAGRISGDRADVIAGRTASLSDADAAYADEVLASVAPGLRVDQLDRKAAALEMKLNPEGVKARKEHARQTRQRVEVRREDSGNASIAVRVRNSGLVDATLPAIRARVMTELLQGRNPLNLIMPRPRIRLSTPGADPSPADGGGRGAQGDSGSRDPDDPGPDYPGDPDEFDGFDDPAAPVADYTGPDGAARSGRANPLPRPLTSTSSSPSAPCSAGPARQRRPTASDCSTPRKPRRSSPPLPATPEPAGPSPSPTRQARQSPTVAPAASIPGIPRRTGDHPEPHHRARSPPVPPRSSTSSAPSTSSSSPPSGQAGTGVARYAARARHHPLDSPQRADPHDPPHRLRSLTPTTLNGNDP